jgi:hypothetical protein
MRLVNHPARHNALGAADPPDTYDPFWVMEPLQAKIVTTARGLIDFLSILVEREAVSAEDWRAFAQDETN